MDRWEIGSLVVPVIFLPALRSARRYEMLAPTSEEYHEVLRSASAFFDGVESALIWDEMSNNLLHATEMQVSDFQTFRESLELASFVVARFDLQEEEMLVRHIPLLALSMLLKYGALLVHPQGQERVSDDNVTEQTLSLIKQLLDLVPGRAFDTCDSVDSDLPIYSDDALETENRAFLASMKQHYQTGHRNSRSKSSAIDKTLIAKLLLSNMLHLMARQLNFDRASKLFEGEIAILDMVLRRMPAKQLLGVRELLSGITEASQSLTAEENGFIKLRGVILIVSLLETMRVALPDGYWLHDHRLRLILPDILTSLWPFLSPSSSKSNVEAVRYIWKVQSLSTNRKLIESCISALMVEKPFNRDGGLLNIENARRFGILWSHSNTNYGSHARRSSLIPITPKTASSNKEAIGENVLARPLLLLLDTLEDSQTELFTFTMGWLQASANVQVYVSLLTELFLANVETRIVDFLQYKLQAMQNLRVSGSDTSRQTVNMGDIPIDVDECLYYLRTISNVVKHSSSEIWPSLLARPSRNGHDDMLAAKERHPQAHSDEIDSRNGVLTTQICLTQICLQYLSKDFEERTNDSSNLSRLQQAAVSLLQEVILRSTSLVDIEAQIESPILSALSWSIQKPDHSLQVSLMSLVSVLLKRRLDDRKLSLDRNHLRILSGDQGSQRTLSRDRFDKDTLPVLPPSMLLDCIFKGLASTGSQPVLNHWIRFLDLCLPFYISNIFQIVMPLVDCLAKALESLFEDLQSSFERRDIGTTAAVEPVNTIIELLNGIEQVLARTHDRLTENETTHNNTKTPEYVQGFFGNMVSGVFPTDVYKSRSAGANNRLTVLLCFKDAVKLCLRIWSWGSGSETSGRDPTLFGSFNHTSLRLKNRSRRILEHMFAAESLECLETLIYSWRGSQTRSTSDASQRVILDLLHVLDGSRPRSTIPAIFNALYSRTNPGALDPERKSTLTSDLSDIDIARFLVEYARSLEDDAMDEIWNDCMTFLRDVLTNPLPHRQTLPKLIEFTALLGIKVDNTNFGENRKRRRELAVKIRRSFILQNWALISSGPFPPPTDRYFHYQTP